MRSGVMTVAAVLALAVCAGAEWNVLWEWPYDPGSAASSMPASYGSFQMADDFQLDAESTVHQVDVYGLYINGTPGSDFEVSLYADDGGIPGELLLSDTCTAGNTLTGDTWGYYNFDIYLTELELSEGLPLDPGSYWLSVWYTGDKWYWFSDDATGNSCREEGTGWEPFGGYQLVFSVLGEEDLELQADSWGAIKAAM